MITDEQGHNISTNEWSKTYGADGPIPLSDIWLINKLAHFDGERIPERVVHAKGAGAFGYFQVTHDVSMYCCAKYLDTINKCTPVAVRFSTVGGEKGSADTARDPRGFSVKHYTEDGNYDFVGNNTPVFFIRDGASFPDFIHTQKRNPQSNLRDPDAVWDFLSLKPESVHQVTVLYSDRGTPDGYRQMNGYSGHSFIVHNEKNERFYIKIHYKTDQGIKNLVSEEAARLAGSDPDYATRDLFNSIQKGEFPQWSVKWQVMPEKDASSYEWDVLDITKVWPHKEYPLIPVGKMVLDRNPLNYFEEVEQIAFSPGNLVRGILPSEDRMLQARLFSYPDSQRHRLGRNYGSIKVNCPYAARNDIYNRDGAAPTPVGESGLNHGNKRNHCPNSYKEEPTICKDPTIDAPYTGLRMENNLQRYPKEITELDFKQAGILYRDVLTDEERDHLISNIAADLGNASRHIQARQICNFSRADAEYGSRVATAIGLDTAKL